MPVSSAFQEQRRHDNEQKEPDDAGVQRVRPDQVNDVSQSGLLHPEFPRVLSAHQARAFSRNGTFFSSRPA
jgi:hypothetical protein